MGETVTAAVTSVLDMAGDILTTVTGNAVLVFILAGGVLVPIAIRTIKKLIRVR